MNFMTLKNKVDSKKQSIKVIEETFRKREEEWEDLEAHMTSIECI